jgi:hypothetical protein
VENGMQKKSGIILFTFSKKMTWYM